MLRAHNDLRAAIGAPAVRSDVRVTAASQRHAEYLAHTGAIGHEETPGDPGFTGVTVRDRLAAQGYADAMASEVAASSDSGTEDVRFLWDLPYHRLGLMHPHAVLAGWGHAEIDGHTATVGVLVFDFAAVAPDHVRSPAAGQHVTGSWAGDESPDALPPGAVRPVGYPVMVVYSSARPVDLKNAKLTDASGREVVVSVVPQIYERDYAAIVPTAPLAAGARYHVRLELSLDVLARAYADQRVGSVAGRPMNGTFSPIASNTGTIWLWRSSGRTFCSWNATAASSFSSSALATGAFAALCASSFSICGSANVAKEEVINDRTPSWTTRSIGFSPPHALAVERRRGAVLPCLS